MLRGSYCCYICCGAYCVGDGDKLAADAQLLEPVAHQIAAAINRPSVATAGLYAVKQALPSHITTPQIKVVAALMATASAWFANKGAADGDVAAAAMDVDAKAQHVDGLDLESESDLEEKPLAARLSAKGAMRSGDAAAGVSRGGGGAGAAGACSGSGQGLGAAGAGEAGPWRSTGRRQQQEQQQQQAGASGSGAEGADAPAGSGQALQPNSSSSRGGSGISSGGKRNADVALAVLLGQNKGSNKRRGLVGGTPAAAAAATPAAAGVTATGDSSATPAVAKAAADGAQQGFMGPGGMGAAAGDKVGGVGGRAAAGDGVDWVVVGPTLPGVENTPPGAVAVTPATVKKVLGDCGALTARQLEQKLGLRDGEAVRKLSGVLVDLVNEEEVYYKSGVKKGGGPAADKQGDGVVYCLL